MRSHLTTIRIYLSLLRDYLRAKRLTSTLFRKLASQFPKYDWVHDAAHRRRVEFYVLQSVLVAEWVSILRGTKISGEERHRAVCLAALTPIMDDIMDSTSMNASTIIQRVHDTNNTEPILRIAHYLYHSMNYHEAVFDAVIGQALEAQDASLVQIRKEFLDEETLKCVTRNKGGYATLLYAVVIDGRMSEAEQEAFLELGYSLQLVNDMFDVFKDRNSGQQTLFTNTHNIESCASFFYDVVDQVCHRFAALPYKPSRIRELLMNVSVIWGRASVCLEQLQSLPASDDQPFATNAFSRKQLICDMEKKANLWKAFKYSARLYASLNRPTLR